MLLVTQFLHILPISLTASPAMNPYINDSSTDEVGAIMTKASLSSSVARNQSFTTRACLRETLFPNHSRVPNHHLRNSWLMK